MEREKEGGRDEEAPVFCKRGNAAAELCWKSLKVLPGCQRAEPTEETRSHSASQLCLFLTSATGIFVPPDWQILPLHQEDALNNKARITLRLAAKILLNVDRTCYLFPFRGCLNIKQDQMESICKTTAWLREELDSLSQNLRILDCRSRELYDSSHVEKALHVALPGLMLRRLRKGNLSAHSLLPGSPPTVRGVALLYDECTSSLESLEASQGDEQEPILVMLLHKLRKEGCQAYYLQGGFSKFQAEFPHHCETNLDCTSCASNSPLPPTPVLGLGGLSITSDCSDFESDLDREPLSGVDSEGMSPRNQAPSFPVQILPHLYLGSARDSGNIETLAKLGIRYILNVTPNLPNIFEKDGEFHYKQIPISDHWSQNLSQFFPEAIEFIDEAASHNCGVLVHCLAGISRSVTVTVAYLMQKLNLSLNDAYDFVKRKKTNISPNFNFMGQLLDFEKSLGLSSPEDNRPPGHSFFTSPSSDEVFELDSLDST